MDSKMDDSDSEYETEEAVVLVELNGIIDSNFLHQEQNPCKILGIETDEPILQLGHYIFSGEYEDTMGTVVVYEPVQVERNEGEVDTDFQFLCKTDKKLSMKRVFLQEKKTLRTNEPTPVELTNAPMESSVIAAEHHQKLTSLKHPDTMTQAIKENFSSLQNDIRSVCVPSSECSTEPQNFHSMDLDVVANSEIASKNKQMLEKQSIQENSESDSNITALITEMVDTISSNDNLERLEDENSDMNCSKVELAKNNIVNETESSELVKNVSPEKEKGKGKISKKRKYTEINSDIINSEVKKTVRMIMKKVTSSKNGNSTDKRKKKVSKASFTHKNGGKYLSEKIKGTDISNKSDVSVFQEGKLPSKSVAVSSNDFTSTVSFQKSTNLNKYHSVGKPRSPKKLSDNKTVDLINEVSSNSDDGGNSFNIIGEQVNQKPVLNTDSEDNVNQLVQSSTDKVVEHVPCVNNEVILEERYEKCTSSADTKYSTDSVDVLNPCQSSELKQIKNEKNKASSSFLKKRKNHNTNQALTGKVTLCEVSQSATDYDPDGKDLQECETHEQSHSILESCDSISHTVADPCASSTESEVFEKSKMVGGNKTENTNAAKVSSCEVTQSNNSEKMSPKNTENTNECEASVKDSSLDNGAENFYQSARELRMQHVKFEGSLVEVSQSDKECETQKFKGSIKGIKESRQKRMVCSQSSDSSFTFSRETNIDPCVSSCDIKKHSLNEEEISGSSSENENLSTSCEVSQSDKIENLLTENENKREFNECSQSVNSIASASNNVASETEYFHTNISPHSKVIASTKESASKDTSCEVSQSFKSDSLDSSPLKQENLKFAGNSSECEVFAKNDHSESSDARNNSADNSYISSENIFSDSVCVNANNMPNPCEVSQSSSCENDLTSKTGKSSDDKISTNECEVFQSKRSIHDSNMSSEGKKIQKRPLCEVSQSIASEKRINKGKNSGVSHLKAREKASRELGNNCEVSQSLSSEQRLFETNDHNITASKIDMASTSHSSNEYEKEIECESSDDISDDIWNDKHRNKDLTSEVSQSDRSQFRDNSLPHSSKLISTDVGDSSECEVYGQRSLDASLEQHSSQVKGSVREICGSSEDVESFQGTHTSFNLKSECKSSTHEISQSIKYDKSRLNTFSLDKENSTNECDMSGQDGSNTTSEVARDICESSEDVHVSNPIVSFPDECTSSIRDTRVLTNESDHLLKVCDSLSNAETTLLMNETENCNISQSESQTINDDSASVGENNNLSLDSSNVALASVNVSSSVDSLSSSCIDSIYSSSVLSNSSQNYISVSSLNSEVTQSCTKDSSQKQEENTGALNNENLSASLIASETNDEVSRPIEFNGVQSSDDLELTHLTLLNDRVNVLESSSALNECKSLSVDEPGTSSSTAHSFQDDFSGLELVESSTATYPLAQKKETNLAENTNSITEDVKDVHRHIEALRCTSNASSENDDQKQKLNILGISESQSSGQLILRDNLDHSDVGQLSEQQPVPSKMVSSSRAEKQLPGSRPSLLEVIVSSASDFRNSLIHEGNNFVRKKSQHSSPGQAVESSSSNVEATDGYLESFNEAIGYSNELDNQDDKRSFQAGTGPLKDQVNEYPDSEVSGSFEQIHRDSILDEQNNSQHQVSQSSEIVNTHSSTSKVHILPSDITESSQRDFVQSSTSISSVSGCVTLKDSSLNSEQVSSAEESILTSNLDISEVCESSSAQDVLMSDNRNTSVASNSENLGNVTESSTGILKYPANYKTVSQVENAESEVSSSPCDTHYSALDVMSSVDGSGQCSVVEGNIVIQGKLCRESNRPNDLSHDTTVVDNVEASCSNITSNSNSIQCLPCGSSYAKKNEITELHEDRLSSFNVIGSSNEAKGLIQGTSSASVTELDQSEDRIQLHSSQNEGDLSSSDVIFEANVANSPLNEVEIVADVYECDESSASCEMQNNSSLCEVTESHAVTMDDLLESSPGENKVSCSVSEISLNNQTFYKNYGFNENEFCQLSSHEAIAKSPDNCESSYEVNICDNVLAMRSISHSASENEELSMYSHGADFENDSVQSSSFEAPFSVSEQIKVISSPTFTDANCFEVQAPLTSNSFMTLPSETQFLAPDQCDMSLNKFTSSSSSSLCTSAEVTQSSPEDSALNYSTCKDRQSSPSTSSSRNIIHETDGSQLGVLETEDNLYLDNNCTSNNSSHLHTNEDEDYWSQETHLDCTEEIISDESHSDVGNLADSTEDGTDMASSDCNAKL
ncbi:General transcription factor 3C polypeptide 6, partial [Stegodyphus mimosarum]